MEDNWGARPGHGGAAAPPLEPPMGPIVANPNHSYRHHRHFFQSPDTESPLDTHLIMNQIKFVIGSIGTRDMKTAIGSSD